MGRLDIDNPNTTCGEINVVARIFYFSGNYNYLVGNLQNMGMLEATTNDMG